MTNVRHLERPTQHQTANTPGLDLFLREKLFNQTRKLRVEVNRKPRSTSREFPRTFQLITTIKKLLGIVFLPGGIQHPNLE